MLRAATGVIVAAFWLVVVSPASALPGDLVTSFSSDGKLTTNFTTGFESVSNVLVLGDSTIVAVGSAAGGGGRFALARYNSNGTLDTADFGGGDGKVLTNLTTGLDAGFDAALDGSGKIVAVGRAGGGGGRFAVLRYLPNGSLDTTFGGGDGKISTNFTTGDDFAFGVAIQPSDGKIIAVGRAGGSGGVFAVARYTTDGTLDSTFGGDGRITTNFSKGDDRADAVAISADPSEDIVVAGTSNYFGLNGKFAVARYSKADGSPVTTFSLDGKTTTDFTSGFDGGFGVAVTPNDNIVVVGQAGGNAGLASYSADGSLDTTFGGGDGKVTTGFTSGTDYFDDIAIDVNGKLVAAGAANFFGPNSRFAVARYSSADGTLDATFGGGDGRVVTDFTTGFDGAYGLTFDSADDSIVVGGYAGGAGGRFALARYAGG
ncbi:MAG TPA: delta-60 repeat domain-containing protein [Gaiellaceae bacterium]